MTKSLEYGKPGDKKNNEHNVVSKLFDGLEALLDNAWMLALNSVKVRSKDPELADELLKLSDKLMKMVDDVLETLYIIIEEAKSRKQLTYI